jgi:hypothetical protein
LDCGGLGQSRLKNLRARGWAILTRGRRADRITVAEVAIDRPVAVLRAFAAERGSMSAFGLSADDAVERFAAVADRQPVFEIITAVPLESGSPRRRHHCLSA